MDNTRPAHYDSADNNAWTRANLGMDPIKGDPGYEEWKQVGRLEERVDLLEQTTATTKRVDFLVERIANLEAKVTHAYTEIDSLNKEITPVQQTTEAESKGLFVILIINADMASSEDENEPFQVWGGRVYEATEATEPDLAIINRNHPQLSYQIGRVVPLEGDPEF